MLILFSLLAGVSAIALEYMYRLWPGLWLQHLWLYVPLMFVVNYCIYRMVTTPGLPLVGALIVWSFATIGLRTLVSALILRDNISLGTWIALALMVLARISQQALK